MAKVYVSSTFEDLREQREKVRLVLQQLQHADVAMEAYVAEPERPLEKCLADVAASDLYVGIFAWRYGHVPQGQDPMSLSLFWSCGDAGLCPGQDGVDEFDGGGSVVPGAVLAGFPDRVGVVPGAFDGARVGALAARVEVLRAGDLGDDAFERPPLVRGEKPGR